MPKQPPDPAAELLRLAKLVKVMRDVQKQYFKGDRSTATLSQSKDLERRVDKAVAWVLGNRQVQGGLFEEKRE